MLREHFPGPQFNLLHKRIHCFHSKGRKKRRKAKISAKIEPLYRWICTTLSGPEERTQRAQKFAELVSQDLSTLQGISFFKI